MILGDKRQAPQSTYRNVGAFYYSYKPTAPNIIKGV